MRDQIRFGLVRRMDSKVWKIKKERLFLVALNKIYCMVGQEVREILALRIIGLGICIEIEMNSHRNDRFIETARVRMIFRILSKMPFAEHGRRVTGGLERLGDGDFVER